MKVEKTADKSSTGQLPIQRVLKLLEDGKMLRLMLIEQLCFIKLEIRDMFSMVSTLTKNK
ncbi:MAG: hypothetical protein IPG89_20575 [Bacteroidetes bacterium]|nr:hypothetical protein [Bacteroidota bacterium]